MNKSFLLLIVAVLFIGLQTQAQTIKDRSGTSTTSTQTTTNTETVETPTTATSSNPETVATSSNSNATTYSQQIADKVTDVLGDRINLSDSQKNQIKNTGATWIDKLWTRLKSLKLKNPFKK